jgi:hypothetical protein
MHATQDVSSNSSKGFFGDYKITLDEIVELL